MEQDLGYQLAYQRAVQAVIWGMPAVSIASLRAAAFRDLGARYNDVIYMSNVPVPRHELPTATDQAPYVMVMLNLKDGPVVLDVPPAAKGLRFCGCACDAWMVPIVDIGIWGDDAGEGGKYLFLPPGTKAQAPKELLPAPSKTYNAQVVLRPVAGNGTLADAVAYSKRLKVFPLSRAASSPANRYIDAYPKAWRTLPAYDMSFFEILARTIDDEPLQEKDAAMIGLLASIGIRRGTPFLPEGRLARALEAAVKDGRRQMEHYFETPGLAMAPYRPDGHWMVANTTPHEGRSYLVDGKLLIDERAGGYSYWARFTPKKQGHVFSLIALRDSAGQLLNGSSLYRLRVPKQVPAADLWSVTVYGKESKAYLYNDLNRVALGSRDKRQLRTNRDGSMDLYFGPQAPEGKHANWIPADRDFFLVFRLVEPEKAVFNRSFKLPDVERID